MTDSRRQEAIDLIDHYLQLCEDRELETAAGLWAPGKMLLQFPGPTEFRSLVDLAEASRQLYAWVRKHRDHYSVDVEDAVTTVVSRGRLYGRNLHGAGFEDVRYVDVFTMRDGQITGQFVWNDLAVGDALTRTS
jgi:hypothetical protein